MSYCMQQTGGKFVIPPENVDGALTALLGYDRNAVEYELHDIPVQTLAALLVKWSWEAEVKDGGIRDIRFIGTRLRDDDELFRAIAPHIEAGSYIEMMGGDDESWRWYFDGEDMITRWGTLDFEGEKLKVVIHVRAGIAEVASCPANIEVEIVDHGKLQHAA